MQALTLAQNLKNGLDKLSKATPRRTTLPILNHVMLRPYGDDRLRLQATNLEMAITVDIPAKVKEQGELGGATAPYKLFSEWISNMDKDAGLSLTAEADKSFRDGSPEYNNHTLKAECRSYRSTLKGFPVEEYPAIVTPGDFLSQTIIYQVQLPVSKIVQAEQLTYATVDDTTRPAYNGVLFEFKDSCLYMTALDGYRMGHATFALSEATGRHIVLLPVSAANLLAQLAGEAWKQANPKKGNYPQEVTCTFYLLRRVGSEGLQVLIHFPTLETSLFSQSITANYPNYNVLLNTDYKTEITLDRQALLEAVDRVGRLAGVSLDVSIKDNVVGLLAQDAQMGDCYDEVSGWGGEYSPVSFKMAPKYLRDAISQCKAVAIRLRYDGVKIVIQPEGDDTMLHAAMGFGQKERQENHHANYAAV